jgi:hypothetical protein
MTKKKKHTIFGALANPKMNMCVVFIRALSNLNMILTIV